MTMHVAALWRYPIKGFTPESRTALTITENNRAAGDRVWSLRFPHGTSPTPEGAWPKGDGLCLRDHPALARLRLRQDPTGEILLELPTGERRYDLPADGERLEADVTAFLLEHADTPRLRRDLPVRLMGDGSTAMFQDRPGGYLTAHFRGSIAPLEHALGAPVDERRFRSNIAIQNSQSWAEHDLLGRTVSIGGVRFTVDGLLVRCLAINADPDTGERNLRALQALGRDLGLPEPTFGVKLMPLPGQAGRSIEVGAPVTID